MDSRALAEEMRAFNRFYTEIIGSLDDHHEGSELSLAQSRMLFTVNRMDAPEVGVVGTALRLDPAYTSRILGTLEDARLVRRSTSSGDRRRRVVRLTASGKRTLARIAARSNTRMLGLVGHLDEAEIQVLLDAMATIRRLLHSGDDDG